jgi:methylmalonyl-CoA mutase N-terminal domain/subunit
MQAEMTSHAYGYQREIEKGSIAVIGVNKFIDNKKLAEQKVIKVDMTVAERQIDKVKKMKAKRDRIAVEQALEELKKACVGTENTMPYIIAAVKTYATLGEICGIMREVFGEYKPNSAF